MAEVILVGTVTGVVRESDTASRLIVIAPTIDKLSYGVLYETHHAERLLQLYGGRTVEVVESNGRRWIRVPKQEVVRIESARVARPCSHCGMVNNGVCVRHDGGVA